jgi:hypothetical protein
LWFVHNREGGVELKSNEIQGVEIMMDGELAFISADANTLMQAVDQGIIIRFSSGKRTFYPWTQVRRIELLNRS